MPEFGRKSFLKLRTCHQDLQEILCEAIVHMDFTVLEGFRSMERQNMLSETGKSKLQWPNSKHNTHPSRAVDIAPWPIDWNDLDRFRELAELIKKIAKEKGIEIEWGGDWKNFIDMPHFQLKD